MRILAVGDRVRAAGKVSTLVGISGPRILLADSDGTVARLMLAEAMSTDDFEVLNRPRPAPLPRGVAGAATEQVERALWWEGHLLEVLRGITPGAPADAGPRPGYDAAVFSLATLAPRRWR